MPNRLAKAAQRRLNEMKWCTCGHGQPAHHRNVGACAGGTQYGGYCQCKLFVWRKDEE